MMKSNEVKVWALVFGFLLVCEVALNHFEPRLSGDVLHIQSLRELSARLARDPAQLKVLWLGNSITAEGINVELADSLIENAVHREIGVYSVHPDGSGIAEWVHIADNEFFERGNRPDVLVVPFAWNLLSDQSMVDAERIGRWYLRGPSDWLDFLRFDANGFEESARAVLANLSAMFGNRDRVRTRVLAALPGYEGMALRLSRGGDAADEAAPPTTIASYARLTRLADAAREARTHVVLVAMPVREPYQLEPGLLATAERLHLTVIDARVVEGLDVSSYRDDMHLLPAGARMVTQRVTTELVQAGRRNGAWLADYVLRRAP
jgi:hypothetical protein